MRDAMLWLSKATGVGYAPPPIPDELHNKPDEIATQVEALEQELFHSGRYERRTSPRG